MQTRDPSLTIVKLRHSCTTDPAPTSSNAVFPAVLADTQKFPGPKYLPIQSVKRVMTASQQLEMKHTVTSSSKKPPMKKLLTCQIR